MIAELQNNHSRELEILELPKSSEKIRLAIGSSFLNKNSYYVVEEEGELIGFIEQYKQNHSHVMISYPYVSLSHPNREAIQMQLLENTLKKLKKYGYQFVSTQVSKLKSAGESLFRQAGFDQKKTIFQSFVGMIDPDPELSTKHLDFRRIKHSDADLTYRWIKRQLNPMSPIYLNKENYERMLTAPKKVRDGWSMAVDAETRQPVGMVSSMVDAHTGDVVVFGPFNDPDERDNRIAILNELLWYHRMQGREFMKLMRIELFDNDEDLIDFFNLEQQEEVNILTKQLY